MADMGQRRGKTAAPALWHKEPRLPLQSAVFNFSQCSVRPHLVKGTAQFDKFTGAQKFWMFFLKFTASGSMEAAPHSASPSRQTAHSVTWPCFE